MTRWLAPGLALLLSAAWVAPAAAQAPSAEIRAEHQAAAQRYIDAMTMRRLLTPFVVEYMAPVPLQLRARVGPAVLDRLDTPALRLAVAAALAQAYSREELEALAGFYGTPMGQGLLDKQFDAESNLNFVLREPLLAAIRSVQQAAPEELDRSGRR